MIRAYSFDVYDTLLTRPMLRPTDLFYIVALQLLHDKNGFSPNDYQIARQQAEKRARDDSKPRDDCQFVDIFKHFHELDKWGITAKEAIETELETERSMTRPININTASVRNLFKTGKTVFFISDMYLPGDFIWELICKHVVPCDREIVLTSSDLGLAKYTGRLYKYLLKRYSIIPSELQHFGDNHYSDINVPRKLGINVKKFFDIQPTRYECFPKPIKQAPLWLSGAGGVARAARLALTKDSAPIGRIACNVIAPFLTAFVDWVLKDARRKAIERLYFVSRDGQIFFKIACIIRKDGDPECRYIYGSRQAWYLPSVIEINPKNLDWAWTAGMSRSGDDILRRLEIDTPEIRNELEHHGFDAKRLKIKLNEDSFNKFRSLLLSEPFSETVLDRARYQRKLTQTYLRQEGMFDAKNWALVDVGWTLKCQQALSSILTDAGYKEKVRGYYLGVGKNHVPIKECGPCYPFVTPSGSNLESLLKSNWFFKLTTIILIEHLFTIADHPTACCYQQVGGQIEPVFKIDSRNKDVIAFGRAMHDAILHYVNELKDNPLVKTIDSNFRERAFKAMFDFCMQPEADDVLGIAWLPTNKDQSHEKQHLSKLASALTLTDLLAMVRYDMLPRHEAFFVKHFAWTAGSMAISSPHIRFLYRTLYLFNQIRTKFRPSL